MSPSATDLFDLYELSPEQHYALYKASSSLEGQTPQVQSKDDLLLIHEKNLKQSRALKDSAKQIIIPAAYSPSTSSLDTLQKISINNLKLETHHRGCFLTARTITSSYNSSEIITIVEDENGTVARLVQGYPSSSPPTFKTGIPIKSTVAIKEPYCKSSLSNDWIIRVDHPSDIAILRGDDAAVRLIMQLVAEKKEISPEKWREEGDKAYLNGKFDSAVECYTQAIDTSPPSSQTLMNNLLKKRAFANLTARSYTSARTDALSSISPSSPNPTSDSKSYFCAGLASYALSQYTTALTHFQSALNLSPSDLKTKKEVSKTETRIREFVAGVYDFASMMDAVKSGKMDLDHAHFISKTEIKESPGRGRGLFAKVDFKKGDLVLVEKAFCLPEIYDADLELDREDPISAMNGNGKDGDGAGDVEGEMRLWNLNTGGKTQRPAQAMLFLMLLEKVYGDMRAAERFFELDGGGYIRCGSEAKVVDGVPVVDAFLTEAIRMRNCFSCPLTSLSLLTPLTATKSSIYNPHTTPLSTGLWIHAAYLNHSCLPNCIRSFIGNMMIIRATKDIKAGEELVQQYRASDGSYLKRKEVFERNWGFTCDCPLCLKEGTSPVGKHEERVALVENIKAEVMKSRNANGTVSMTRIRNVERLRARLEKAHENEVYEGVPRLLLLYPCIWLMERYREKGDHAMVIRYAGEVLMNFGFGRDVVDEGRLDLDFERGIVNTEVMQALRAMGDAFRGLGKGELAEECEGEARKIFGILTGCDVSVEEFFKR